MGDSAAEQNLARDQDERCEEVPGDGRRNFRDECDYNKLYKQFGKCLKLGIHEESYEQFGKCLKLETHEGSTIRAKIPELLKLNTSESENVHVNRRWERRSPSASQRYFWVRSSMWSWATLLFHLKLSTATHISHVHCARFHPQTYPHARREWLGQPCRTPDRGLPPSSEVGSRDPERHRTSCLEGEAWAALYRPSSTFTQRHRMSCCTYQRPLHLRYGHCSASGTWTSQGAICVRGDFCTRRSSVSAVTEGPPATRTVTAQLKGRGPKNPSSVAKVEGTQRPEKGGGPKTDQRET